MSELRDEALAALHEFRFGAGEAANEETAQGYWLAGAAWALERARKEWDVRSPEPIDKAEACVRPAPAERATAGDFTLVSDPTVPADELHVHHADGRVQKLKVAAPAEREEREDFEDDLRRIAAPLGEPAQAFAEKLIAAAPAAPPQPKYGADGERFDEDGDLPAAPAVSAPEAGALDEVLAFFYPGERARACGDVARADTYDAAVAELQSLRAAPKPSEDAQALRDSLAQEIRGVLRTRNCWAPERDSDLIVAVAKALDANMMLAETYARAAPKGARAAAIEECIDVCARELESISAIRSVAERPNVQAALQHAQSVVERIRDRLRSKLASETPKDSPDA